MKLVSNSLLCKEVRRLARAKYHFVVLWYGESTMFCARSRPECLICSRLAGNNKFSQFSCNMNDAFPLKIC